MQKRSQATQDLILDAAEELFAKDGIAGTSVQDVASAAGRSIGSLYHHFDTKEILVHAVIDRILGDMEHEMTVFFDDERWEGRSIGEVLSGYIRGLLNLDRVRPGYKQIGREAAISDPETRKRYVQVRHQVNDGLHRLISARKSQIGNPDPGAIDFAIDQLVAMLAFRIDPDLTPSRLYTMEDAEFVSLCLQSTLGLLQVSPEKPKGK